MYQRLHLDNLPDLGKLEKHISYFGTNRHPYYMSYLVELGDQLVLLKL